MDIEAMVRKQFEDSTEVFKKATDMAPEIAKVVGVIIEAYKNGGKVLLCGNGGSAADCQHIACELVSKLELNRGTLPAIAVTTNTSLLTAIGNDYGYDHIFERQLESLTTDKDIVIGISTSGNSPNIVRAFRKAHEKGAKTIALTGMTGGKFAEGNEADLMLKVPSKDVQRIQEVHIALGHIICKAVEQAMFGEQS